MMNSVPAAIVSGLICLVLGIGVGAGGMMAVGYKTEKPQEPETTPGPMGGPGGGPGAGGGPGGGRGGPGGGRGGPMGGFGGGAGGGQRGPSPKTQLATLVTKLDQLTEKSLHVELTADEKKKIHEQLKDLADKEELSDDDAKARLDALLEILKDKKETMEAAGYRWPGAAGGFGGGPGGGGPGGGGPGGGGPGGGFGGGPAGGGPPANPFTTEANKKALKSLEARTAK